MAFNEKFNPLRFSNGLQSRTAHQTPEHTANYECLKNGCRVKLPLQQAYLLYHFAEFIVISCLGEKIQDTLYGFIGLQGIGGFPHYLYGLCLLPVKKKVVPSGTGF